MPTDYSPWSKQIIVHIPSANNATSSSSLTGGGGGSSSLTSSSSKSSSNINAYFAVTDGSSLHHLIIKLTDPIKIQKARNQINGTEPKLHILGNIVKEKACYNPAYNWHLDPDTINFFEVAMEVCDSNFRYVEEHLQDVGGALLPGNFLCVWNSNLVSEIQGLSCLSDSSSSLNINTNLTCKTLNSINNISNVLCEPSWTPKNCLEGCRGSVSEFGINLEKTFSMATCGKNSPLGGGNLAGQILFSLQAKFVSNVNKLSECGNSNWKEKRFIDQPYWNNWSVPCDLLKENKAPVSYFFDTTNLSNEIKSIYNWIKYPYISGADVTNDGGQFGSLGELYKQAGCKQILNIKKNFYPGSVCQGSINLSTGIDLGAEIDFISTNPWATFFPKIEIFSEGNDTTPIYVHKFRFNHYDSPKPESHLLSGMWYTSDIDSINMTNSNFRNEEIGINSVINPVCFCRDEGFPTASPNSINNHWIRIWGHEGDGINSPYSPLRKSTCGSYKNLKAKVTLQALKIRISIRDKIEISELDKTLCRNKTHEIGNEPKIEVKAIDLIDLPLVYNLDIPSPTSRPNDYCCCFPPDDYLPNNFYNLPLCSSSSSSSSTKLCNNFILDCAPGFIKVCPNPKPCPNSDEGCSCQPSHYESSNTSQMNFYRTNSLNISEDGKFIIK